jgi:hypothetical protein
LGGDAKNWVVHTKGGTPAQHEWRPLLSQMLRELVASGGMKPQGAGGKEPPDDLRYREKWGPLDPNQPDGWPQSHLITEQIRQCGLMSGCWYGSTTSAGRHKGAARCINTTTAWDIMDELIDAGRAIISERFRHAAGSPSDWRCRPRTGPIPDGKYKATIAKWLPELVYGLL